MDARPNPAEHLKLARWVVDRFLRRKPWFRHLHDDLHSAALTGLCEAVRDYDSERGTWAALAVTAMEHNMLNEVKRIAGPVRTPSRQRTAQAVSLDEEHGVEADAEVATRLAHELRGTQRAEGPNRPRTLLDVLAADGDTPEREAAAMEAVRLLSGLEDRQRDVIARRCADETLAEIGERFGVSRERVRQIEQKALKRLRWRHCRDL